MNFDRISLSVVNENVSLVISRQVLTDVCTRLQSLPDEISRAVSHYTLDKVFVIGSICDIGAVT